MRKTWIFSFLILLTGCFGPNYEPPCLCIPEAWRMQAHEGSTLCNARWWEEFQDPVLEELIFTALANNQDLKVAIARVFEYCARLGIANAPLLPNVNLAASYNRAESSLATPIGFTPGVGRINNDFQGVFNLNWELDFWGRIRSASAAACADMLSQIEARRAVVVTVVSSVAEAYFVLRGLDAQLDISKRTLESRLDSLRLAEDRFQLGETSQIEVKQAESEVEIAAIRVIEFERAIPKQENLLSILLGENPRCIDRGLAIEAFPLPLEIPAGLPSDLLCRRPDIVEAEEKLIAANARISEAFALFFPQITLTGQYGSESDQLSEFLTSPATLWQYGLNLLQPIFNAGKTYFQVEAARALTEEALYTYCQTILNAFREVDDALITYQKDRELVLEHTKQVQILKEYLNLAQLRYSEGEIDYLNVLDAERLLFDAQLQLAQAQADSLSAVVQLYSALGGGWVNDADAVAITDALID